MSCTDENLPQTPLSEQDTENDPEEFPIKKTGQLIIGILMALPVVLIVAAVILNIITSFNKKEISTQNTYVYNERTAPEPNRNNTPPQSSLPSVRPPEYKLAVINAGGYIDESDWTIKIFSEILDYLSNEFHQSRERIADLIVFSHKDYRKSTGRSVTLLWIAQQLKNSAPRGAAKKLGISFEELAATWLTLAAAQ